jgi:hypothetical protein
LRLVLGVNVSFAVCEINRNLAKDVVVSELTKAIVVSDDGSLICGNVLLVGGFLRLFVLQLLLLRLILFRIRLHLLLGRPQSSLNVLSRLQGRSFELDRLCDEFILRVVGFTSTESPGTRAVIVKCLERA